MRKLYDKFFYIPKHGKIRENVLVARVIVSVAIVLSCLLSMGITAFAYFTCDVAASNNIVKAANMETKVSIRLDDKNGEEIDVVTSDYKSHWAELSANKTYYVTLKHTEKSQVKTGFMVITAENCGKKYHTQQIAVNDNGESEVVAFTIKPTAATKITFLSHWGTSSLYGDFEQTNDEIYIENGETVNLTVKTKEKTLVVEEKTENSISVNATKKETAKDNSSVTESSKVTSSKPEANVVSKEESKNQASSEIVTSSQKDEVVSESMISNTASTDNVTTQNTDLDDTDLEIENDYDSVTREDVVTE